MPTTRRLALALAAAALGACASAPCRDATLPPPALHDKWESARDRDHPLVGHVWDVKAQRYVDAAALDAAAADAHFLLLGETHDNPDHHRLQARLVRAATAGGRRPALALEMLDTDQQAAVDTAQAAPAHGPDDLARAVKWDQSGWPKFALYRPIFEAAAAADLRIVAANLPRKVVRDVVMTGRSALPGDLRERLARDEPLQPALLASLRKEMGESHCGKLPEQMFDPLVLAQRARDAEMAERLAAADRGAGAILVAGAGHVRDDRGVPVQLARDAPGKRIVAVAFVEVSRDACAPQAYAESLSVDRLPFDYVVFTPGAEREDPCATFKVRHPPPKAPAKPAAPSA